MIRNSFIFLERVDKKTEQNIWKQNIRNWDDFLNADNIKGISKKRKGYYKRKIIEARKHLYNFDSSYFIDKLPLTETWRLYDFFKDEAVFLDIETSGVSNDSFLTVIGLFDGLETRTMIKGINLNLYELKKELRKYKLIITFNGSVFDIPFLKKRYPDLIPKILHWDLRSGCVSVGLNGGLKNIEKKLKIKRNKIIEKLYGGDALTLWKMWKATADDYYLKLLVEYNEEDIINLKKIADYVYGKLLSKTI